MTVFLWLSVVLVVTISIWVTIIIIIIIIMIICQYRRTIIITRCQYQEPGVSAGQCVTSWPQLLQCGLRYVTGKYSTLIG